MRSSFGVLESFMRASVPFIAAILWLSALLALSGCGLKGDLYLPDEPPAPQAASQVETSPSAPDEDEAED